MQQQGMNSQDNREHNRAAILTLIRSNGPVSRAELARLSGLSKPVVTDIVDSLMSADLVFESYKARTGLGRRPVMLELNQDHLRIVGIDLARTQIELMVTDLAGECLESIKQELDTEAPGISGEQILESLRWSLEQIQARHELIGIGIGCPIPLSTRGHIVVGASAPEGWSNIDLENVLCQEFGVPVFVGNDANVAALYEKWYGEASKFQDFLYVMVGKGVGAGIFCNGNMLLGKSGIAGEFGHMSINPGGAQCVCGNRGCLETELSVNALLRKAALASEGRISSLELLLEQLAADDRDMQHLLTEYASVAGRHIGNLIDIFNPEAVIIGGEIARLERFLVSGLRQSIEDTIHPMLQGSYEFTFSEATENKVAKGASVLVQQHFFAYPHKYIPAFERVSS